MIFLFETKICLMTVDDDGKRKQANAVFYFDIYYNTM